MKALVVYYSRTGNTKQVAEMIAGELKADLEELVDKKDRRGLLGYLRSGRDAVRDKTTELKPLQRQSSDYDLIFVGTPVWASRPAPAVRAFLESQDLSGKRVALFCTMASRGEEATFSTMRMLFPQAEVAGQLAVAMRKENRSQIEERVAQWVTPWKSKD
ncbi:MAG: hypothetical protein AMJ92_04895 [candidate division Zixibacteria bacterium SM23_81]|nr:MAG: hypothetical protein AMJ92_04895 [candidate division Zixibacteria bacterium SM23_81]